MFTRSEKLDGRSCSYKIYLGHAQPVRALTFAPDNITLISGSDDHCINIYDVEHGNLASVLEGHDGWILSVAANPDISKQQLASVSSDKKVKVWDLAMRSVIETHEVHEDAVSSFFSTRHRGSGTILTSILHIGLWCGMECRRNQTGIGLERSIHQMVRKQWIIKSKQ